MLDRTSRWQQGQTIELEIVDLNHDGEGVGRFENRVVFVADTAPGDLIIARLLFVKKDYAKAKLIELKQSSRYRIRPRCIVADKCGGCQWQHIDYDYQQQAKLDRLQQTLTRIGGFENPAISPIINASEPLGYRNKSTYPLGISATGNLQAGYYRKGSHQIVNLNQCPIQDSRLNPILQEVKIDLQARGWSVYNETTRQGQLRHLSLRIGRHTGEMLLTLVTSDLKLVGVAECAEIWLAKYPQLVGVALNHNPKATNAIFGEETVTIAGKPYLREIFAGLELQLLPDTFFQVNTIAAEQLLTNICDRLQLKGDETLIDAYCGIGTFTLPLAKKVKQTIGIEIHAASIDRAQNNAKNNEIDNTTFYIGKVEDVLPKLTEELEITADIIILDPPRKGCDRLVLESLCQTNCDRLVYISCNPATLARDLKILCETGNYRLDTVLAADFFPQTPHLEAAAFLVRNSD
jgi:23S rRNA (uracil1939-C5)-methyltransferase